MNLSPITVIGNITADPELAFLGSGTPKLIVQKKVVDNPSYTYDPLCSLWRTLE